MNRLLGRMSAAAATAFVTGVAVMVAIGLHWLLGLTSFFEFDTRLLVSATIVTILTGAPIVYYSQSIIRELKTSRHTLRLMTEKLAVAFHNAEHANEAKSKFLANMSHELRTPLNAIIGFSDIMQNELMGPLENARYRDYAHDINASGAHLLGIINDILDLAKIESGRIMLGEDEEFDVVECAEAACTMVRPLAARQSVELFVVLPPQDIALSAIARMFRQILINILSNALKFTPAGGLVSLSIELRPNGNLAVTIADTGIGMSPEDMKIALTPFGQVHSEMSRGHIGTGLGLPLANAMMEMHGGRLVLRSKPGQGTTVVMILPAARVKLGDARNRVGWPKAS